MAVLERFAVDLIIFTEIDTVSPLYRHAQDDLLIVETYNHDQMNFGCRDNLSVVDFNSIQIIRHRAATDTITITDSYKRGVQDRAGIDTLIFIETFEVSEDWFHTSDTLTITETNDYTISTPVSDLIEFTESYDYNIIRNFSVTDEITITEGYNAYFPDPWNPSYTIPNITGTDPIMFRDGSLEYVSRHYEFGNTELVEFTRVIQESRGGDLIVGPITAQVETLNFNLLQLTESKCQELQEFIRTTLGKEIEFKDHEGVWWDGVIMNPGTNKVQTGRHKFTMSIQFEGTRQ
jgi:hypothetical protein